MQGNEYEYETSMKSYRDLKNSLDTKWEEGMEEGMKKGMRKGMKEGLEKGMKKGREEGIAIGIEKGREEGKAEGEAEANLRIAKNMLADGFPIEVIMKYSHLSREDVEKLKGE